MKIPDGIWRLNLMGAIAVGNLSIFGACLLYQYLTGAVPGRDSTWVEILTGVLILPLSQLAYAHSGFHSPPVLLIVFVPLNAYLWGFVGQFTWRRYQRDPGRFLRSTGLFLSLLAILLIMVAALSLRRFLRDPGEWDGLILCGGTVILGLLVYSARWCLIRAQALHTRDPRNPAPDQPPASA